MKIELAKSLYGHDKNHIYLIWKKEERLAYLVNGTTHTLAKPKRKNQKHYQIIKDIPENVVEILKETENFTDETICRAVRAYERSISQ